MGDQNPKPFSWEVLQKREWMGITSSHAIPTGPPTLNKHQGHIASSLSNTTNCTFCLQFLSIQSSVSQRLWSHGSRIIIIFQRAGSGNVLSRQSLMLPLCSPNLEAPSRDQGLWVHVFDTFTWSCNHLLSLRSLIMEILSVRFGLGSGNLKKKERQDMVLTF